MKITGHACGTFTAAQTLRLAKAHIAGVVEPATPFGAPTALNAGGDPLCSMWNDDTDITSCSTSKDSSGLVGTGSNGAASATQACCLLTVAASFGAGATSRD